MTCANGLIYNGIDPLLKWQIAMNQYLIPNTERLVNKIYLHVCFERGSFLIIAIDVCVDLRFQTIIGTGHQISKNGNWCSKSHYNTFAKSMQAIQERSSNT